MDVWVGIEVTRLLRVAQGVVQPAGSLAVGGVNLLEHQIGVAKQLAPADNICVLSPQGDEALLELVSRHEVREIAPMDFIGMLAERARRGEAAAVVHLRQIAPLCDASAVQKALKLLGKHPVVVSASKPQQPGADPRCLAFEVRRLSQFSMQAMAAPGAQAEELLFIEPEDYAEYIRPEDEAAVAARFKLWR